jgi:LysM repeat protein
MQRTLLLAMLLATVCSCGSDGRGFVFDEQGGGDNTPERARDRTARRLCNVIHDEVAITGDIQVHIREMPTWHDGGRHREEGWYFAYASVTVRVPASDNSHDDDIREAARSYLRPAVIGGIDDIAITVEHSQPSPTPENVAVTEISPASTASTAPANKSGTYIIQAGDTLAQISAVFYGSPQHWRRIAEANAGLDPADLHIGETIRIPPAP